MGKTVEVYRIRKLDDFLPAFHSVKEILYRLTAISSQFFNQFNLSNGGFLEISDLAGVVSQV